MTHHYPVNICNIDHEWRMKSLRWIVLLGEKYEPEMGRKTNSSVKYFCSEGSVGIARVLSRALAARTGLSTARGTSHHLT